MKFDKLFEMAKEAGIQEFQVTSNDADSLEISGFNGSLEALTIAREESLSFKGIYNGKMGYYYTNILSTKEFPVIIKKVIESANAINSTDEVELYEGDKKYGKIKNGFNNNLKNIPIDEKISFVKNGSTELKNKENVVNAESGYEEVYEKVVMKNSKGLNVKSSRNYAFGYMGCIASKDNDTRVNYEIKINNDFNSFNSTELLNKAYDGAIKQIGAKPIKSGEYEAVFSEDVTATLLKVFSGLFSADNVQKNISLFKDKVGQQVAAKCVTLIDDPFLENSIHSKTFDEEGVATTKKELIKNGVLTRYLYNIKTAKKDNVQSTGNAIHGSVSPVCLYLKPGKKTTKELIKSVKNGIYITGVQGAHAGVNPYAGTFSLQATGYLIEDGVETSPVCLITIAGSIFEVLNDIVEVSKEVVNYYDSTAIKVKKIAVAGI